MDMGNLEEDNFKVPYEVRKFYERIFAPHSEERKQAVKAAKQEFDQHEEEMNILRKEIKRKNWGVFKNGWYIPVEELQENMEDCSECDWPLEPPPKPIKYPDKPRETTK